MLNGKARGKTNEIQTEKRKNEEELGHGGPKESKKAKQGRLYREEDAMLRKKAGMFRKEEERMGGQTVREEDRVGREGREGVE